MEAEEEEITTSTLSSTSSSSGGTTIQQSSQQQQQLLDDVLPLLIKEWDDCSPLLSRIPSKAQKGLHTFPLHLTRVASAGEYLALATNVGLIYWIHRPSNNINRLKTENTGVSITALQVISGPDLMIGVGNEVGELSVFQIHPQTGRVTPFNLVSSADSSTGLHSSPISCLEWSSNGLLLFSGDTQGGVGLTELDFESGGSRCRPLILPSSSSSSSAIVQLSYLKKSLLICSTLHSIIFSLETNSWVKVGSQGRKQQGGFGGLWKKNKTLYSVRPGGRIWVSDAAGVVQHTIKFKHVFLLQSTNNNNNNIPLINPSSDDNAELLLDDFQIGLLRPFPSFSSTALLSWWDNLIMILEPQDETRVLGICRGLRRGVVDVTVNQETGEIWILEDSRWLRRLASYPDPYHQNLEFQDSDSSLLKSFMGSTLLPLLKNVNVNAMEERMNEMNLKGLNKVFLDSPLALLKETSKRVQSQVKPHSSSSLKLFQGLKQVFLEGDVVDGTMTTSIPIPMPGIPTSNDSSSHPPQEEEEEVGTEETEEDSRNRPYNNNSQQDRFCHISHLPFDEVLLTPPTSILPNTTSNIHVPQKNKRKRAKNKKTRKQHGDTGSISSSTSKKSNHHFSDPEEDENSCKMLTLPGQSTPLMSQSWSVGQNQGDEPHPPHLTDQLNIFIPDADATAAKSQDDELESKEEILALKLNWPELLPDSKRGLIMMKLEPATQLPVLPPIIAIVEDLVTTPTPPEEEEDQEESLVEDIYTKYRDPFEPEDCLSFGPPSSYSSTSNPTTSLPSSIQPLIVEINEHSLPTQSEEEEQADLTTPTPTCSSFNQLVNAANNGRKSKSPPTSKTTWWVGLGVGLGRLSPNNKNKEEPPSSSSLFCWEIVSVHRPGRRAPSLNSHQGWVGVQGGSIYKEHGVLWLMDKKGKLYYINPSSQVDLEIQEAKPIDLPCSSSSPLIVVPAPDALWLLSSKGEGGGSVGSVIYGRGNISSINQIGWGWAKIDLSSQERLQHLVHVSCGCDVAWGVDFKGRIFLRLGSLRPPSSLNDMSPVWVELDESDEGEIYTHPPHFTKVYVGTNGSMVWAIDSKNNIYTREAVYPDFPIGTRWLFVTGGVTAISLSLSETGVWALSPQGSIFRRYGISATNFVGDYWEPIPSPSPSVVDLSVSLCDQQVWALDKTGTLYKLNYQQTQQQSSSKEELKTRTVLDPEDSKEWELIESLDLI